MGNAASKIAKKKVLGRGLSALISARSVPVPVREESPVEAEELKEMVVNAGVSYVLVDLVLPNHAQPRKSFNELELKELSESIRQLGVLQPILVRKSTSTPGSYEIVAGERRYRAAKLAGLKEVPVILKDFDNKAALEVALVENIQRSNLNPLEEAQAYQSLIEDFSLNQQELAERIGKDRATVANFLRLLKLPPDLQDFLRDGSLSMGHAKAILTVKEAAAQRNLAKKCIEEGLSVRALENIVGRVVELAPRRKEARAAGEEAVAFPEVLDRLRNKLGTKVTLQHSKEGSGTIQIHYYSEEELDRLVDLIAV